MLTFTPIKLDDKSNFNSIASKKNYHLCEHCFTDIFIWKDHYDTQIAYTDEFVFLKMKSFDELEEMYLAPLGTGDLKKAINLLIEDAKFRNIPFKMVSVPEEMINEIENIMPDTFSFDYNRDGSDYIYLADSLITLKGKKLQSKRNFINRFMRTYEDRWQYEDITNDLLDEVYEFHKKWCKVNGCAKDKSFLGETCAIHLALDNLETLGIQGGLIRLDGEIIAFTLGSKCSDDMFVVQIEKADAEIRGAYQMINQQFSIKNFSDIKYINREEDLGIEGLRKAKLSYYPYMMGNKYIATFKE